MKFLWIIILVGILVYFIARRFFMGGPTTAVVRATAKNGYRLVDTNAQIISQVTKNTMTTVGIGLILFLVVLLLGLKIKIIWIALPLTLYLMGQFFVYTNHIKATKDQRVFFDPTTNDVLVDRLKEDAIRFNLLRDVIEVTEVKSVQKNKGVLFGYYRIRLQRDVVIIPYLVELNPNPYNKAFFDVLNATYKIQVETKLFPIV